MRKTLFICHQNISGLLLYLSWVSSGVVYQAVAVKPCRFYKISPLSQASLGLLFIISKLWSNCLESTLFANYAASIAFIECLAGSFTKVSISFMQVSSVSRPFQSFVANSPVVWIRDFTACKSSLESLISLKIFNCLALVLKKSMADIAVSRVKAL